MKAVVINGSSRGAKGITQRLLSSFEKGLSDSGCDVSSYNLSELNIGHCRSCFHCMHVKPGICSIKDDMESIYEALKTSDLLVMGTPLYTDSMSSRMKVFFDRCIACMQPFLRVDESGRFRHTYNWRLPARFVLISTSGFPEVENFNALELTVKAQAYNVGSELVASLLIPGSLGLQMDLALLDPHLELIYKAGAEFGSAGCISLDLLESINTPVLSNDEFYTLYLKYEEWCRKRLSKDS